MGLNKKKFPKDPAMVAVCLTKALEDGMVCMYSFSGSTERVNICEGISNAESRLNSHHH
jgi:hypothetical protein